MQAELRLTQTSSQQKHSRSSLRHARFGSGSSLSLPIFSPTSGPMLRQSSCQFRQACPTLTGMQRIELKGLSPQQVDQLLPEGLISLCWRGSVAHGMYVPKSDPDSIDDKDVMGVYIGPLEHYLGFGRNDVYEKWEGEWDCVFYELRKFIGLLLNCNPNVLSLLWLKPNGIIYENELGARLGTSRKSDCEGSAFDTSDISLDIKILKLNMDGGANPTWSPTA